MSDYVLETKNLGISFGGLKAVQDVNLQIKKGQIYGLIGPNGAGKTTVFNLLTGVYKPTTGTFYLNGEELTGKTQEKINHKGIARTFQNIRLFNNMSVIRNVLVGLHNQPEFKCNPFISMVKLPKHYDTEARMRACDLFAVRQTAQTGNCACPGDKPEASASRRAGGRHESPRNSGAYGHGKISP